MVLKYNNFIIRLRDDMNNNSAGTAAVCMQKDTLLFCNYGQYLGILRRHYLTI